MPYSHVTRLANILIVRESSPFGTFIWYICVSNWVPSWYVLALVCKSLPHLKSSKTKTFFCEQSKFLPPSYREEQKSQLPDCVCIAFGSQIRSDHFRRDALQRTSPAIRTNYLAIRAGLISLSRGEQKTPPESRGTEVSNGVPCGTARSSVTHLYAICY